MPRTTLCVILNRSAGTGHDDGLARAFVERLNGRLAGVDIEIRCDIAETHAEIREKARAFAANEMHPVLVAAGGGGTLRAVIEGVCAVIDGTDKDVRISALRMGSGNVLARQFGIEKDPLTALDQLADQLRANVSAPCCVMACDEVGASGETRRHYAATLGGFGLFGRVPGSLERFHKRWPRLHRCLARAIGIERLTNVEYGMVLLRSTVGAALMPRGLEEIEIEQFGKTKRVRVLAGALLNFLLRALPFDTDLRIEDPILSLRLVPYAGRFHALCLVATPRRAVKGAEEWRITADAPLTMRVLGDRAAEYFLDEDSHAFRQVTLRVAASLRFIPGRGYVLRPRASSID